MKGSKHKYIKVIGDLSFYEIYQLISYNLKVEIKINILILYHKA